MNKKKVILLSIFSLVLLFALRGTTYANTYREFNENEIKNFLYNAWINNHTEQEVEQAIETHTNNGNITTITDLLNEYDYCLLTVNSGTNGWNTIEIGLTPTDKHLYWYSNRPAVRNSDNCFKYVLQYSGTLTKTWGFNYSYNVRTDFIYYGMTRYESSNSNVIVFTGNKEIPEDIFNGKYTEVTFNFIPDSNTTVNVQGLTQTFYAIQKEAVTSKLLGKLYKSRLTEGIYSDFYIYNTYSNSWNYLNERVVYNKTDGYIDEFFNTDKTHDYWISDIYIKNNIIAPNIFFRYQFYPMNADFDDYIDIWFYVTDTNTKYNNGVISPALTFSGDYLKQYKEITGQLSEAIEDQKLQDKITDVNDTLTDNSQIDNIIAENLSGDNLIDSLGYSPLENPFTTIILNTMEDFTDALLDSGNETLSFTIFNNNITIHSEDFTLPNGNLKNFITLMCNAFVIYELIKYGFKLYQWINSGRLQNLVNETNNHQYYLF